MARRRRRSPVWLIVGLGVLVVIVVALALPGSSSNPDKQSYLDIIRPQLQSSAQQGGVVNDVRANAATSDRVALSQRLEDLVGGAANVRQQVSAVGAPGSLSAASHSLNDALQLRAQATSLFRSGVEAALPQATGGDPLGDLVKAGQDLIAADNSYGSFLRALPRSMASSISVPEYRWVVNPADWSRQGLGLFVIGTKLSPTLAARHDVAVSLVSTQPAPTSYLGSVAVLGLTRQLTVGVVVVNQGNVGEQNVPVVATLGSFGVQDQVARATIDLGPTQRVALDLAGLRLTPRLTYELTVTAGPVPGDVDPANERQVSSLTVSG